MRSVRLVLSSLLLSTALVPSAFAAAKLTEDWKTGVMRDPKGNFAYCVSEARYENDLWVILALNGQGEVNIGVGQKGAQLPVGGARTSSVQVDGKAAQKFPARVAKPELYVINGGRQSTLLQQIAAGKEIMLDGNAFALTGSGKAIATLKECAAVQGQPVAPAQQNAMVNGKPSLPGQWSVDGAATTQAPAAPQVAENGQPKIVFEDGQNPLAPVAGETVLASTQTQIPAEVTAPEVTAPPPGSLEETTAQVMAVLKDESAQMPAAPAAAPQVMSEATPVASAPVEVATSQTAPEVKVEAPAEVAPAPVASTVAPVAEVAQAAPASAPVINGLPAPLSSLLRQAGLGPIEATPASTGDAYAWSADGLKGVVREELVKPGSNLKELAETKVGLMRSFCDGEFSVKQGAQKLEGDVQVQTLQTRCRTAQQNVYSAWVFSLTKGGVFSSIEHIDPTGKRESADKVQNGLLAALTGKQG
jgi:hypothetical protein